MTGNTYLTQQRSGNAALSEVIVSMQSVQPDNRVEETLKEVMGILYANVEDLASVNEEQELRLREIAQLCPLDDGSGVYIARSALLKIDTFPQNYLNECERVLAPAAWKVGEESVEEQSGFTVFPNPSNGQMSVAYQLAEGERGQVDVYNMIGQTVFSQTLANDNDLLNIRLNGVTSGLYSIRVLVNDKVVLSQKLSILKE